jgi:hypothetical protein
MNWNPQAPNYKLALPIDEQVIILASCVLSLTSKKTHFYFFSDPKVAQMLLKLILDSMHF